MRPAYFHSKPAVYFYEVHSFVDFFCKKRRLCVFLHHDKDEPDDISDIGGGNRIAASIDITRNAGMPGSGFR